MSRMVLFSEAMAIEPLGSVHVTCVVSLFETFAREARKHAWCVSADASMSSKP